MRRSTLSGELQQNGQDMLLPGRIVAVQYADEQAVDGGGHAVPRDRIADEAGDETVESLGPSVGLGPDGGMAGRQHEELVLGHGSRAVRLGAADDLFSELAERS